MQYTSAFAWDYEDKGTLSTKITYRNSSTDASYSATDSDVNKFDNSHKWIVLSGLTGYDVIEIAADGTFGGVTIPAGTFYLINGHWAATAPQTADATFVSFPSGWNNMITSGTSNNILTFNVNPLGDAADATNLAATINATSLMVKYNGTPFCELFADTSNANRAKYKISYEHGKGYFYFTIPEADLVDGATLVIEDGTPFMNYYLEGVTLTYNATSGKWQIPVNYNPSFVSINNSFNNDANGFLVVQFNTTGWEQNGVPTSYSGITYNGNNISDLTSNIKFSGNNSVWFTYTPQASNPKLAAYYHGYSHPTISFAEGATMVYGGNTYTFHAVTFYLNLSTNKWQTAIPDGYEIVEANTFDSIDPSSTADSLVLNYTDELSWTESKGNFASKITVYSGATPSTVTDGNLSKSGAKQITISDLSAYDKIVIEGGGIFAGVIIPSGTFYYNDVENVWQTTKPYCDFVSIDAYYNNEEHGFFIVAFDTTEWEQNGVPTGVTGITYNGNDISDLTTNIKFFQTSSLWFTYPVQASNPKLAAYYNGYSNPTITIAEGATMVY
ncbi:MAG: hypothetical protein J6T42_03100, partial [Clostridia bacterium]|nr:hypothetical protein [Clostridia bacterium]